MANVLQFLNFTDPNALLTTVMLPFILIFVIIWGLLNMSKIFGHGPESKKINIVIALVVTIFTSLTDAWGVLVEQLSVFIGQFALFAFIIVFVIAIIIWAVGRTRGVYVKHSDDITKVNYGDIKRINKEIDKLAKKMEEARLRGKETLAQEYWDDIKKLRERKDYLIGSRLVKK